MTTNHKFILVIALLSGIIIFTVYKYVAALKEKAELQNNLNQARQQITLLEIEKQNLLQQIEKDKLTQQALTAENTQLKEDLNKAKEQVAGLEASLKEARSAVDELNAQISGLKTENENIGQQLAQASQENEEFKMRLGSIIELKKAIRELKKQRHQKKAEGNSGFVIKDGLPTQAAKIKIEVSPVLKE